jgi:hypothetical protein
VTQYEIDLVFKSFRDLWKHSQAMLDGFKKTQGGCFVKMGGDCLKGQYAVASVFCRYVFEFKCYAKYMSNFMHAKSKLEEILGRRTFEKWFKVLAYEVICRVFWRSRNSRGLISMR